MNALQWENEGYRAFFVGGRVYLVRPLSGICVHTEIDGGDWTKHDDVNKSPWVKEPNGFEGLPENVREQVLKEDTALSGYCEANRICYTPIIN